MPGKVPPSKSCAAFLTPDDGTCLINGRVPWKERIDHVRDIGVVFGQRSQLWWDVPVIDSFELIRDIYRVDPQVYRQNLEELVTLLDLSETFENPRPFLESRATYALRDCRFVAP